MRRSATGKLTQGVVAVTACLVAATALGEASESNQIGLPRLAEYAPSAAISVSVSDAIVLPRDVPIAIVYTGSPKLTAMLREALSAEGFQVSESTDSAVGVVRVRGVLQLTGKHTARVPIAALAERATTIDATDARRALTPADVGSVIAAGRWLGHLTRAGELGAPAGGMLFLDIVGQATGAKDWFNRAIGGDRRGLCLVNCADWHKTRQAALHVVVLEVGTEQRRMEVKTEVFAEALQPGVVVSAGLESLLAVLSGRKSTARTESESRNGATAN